MGKPVYHWPLDAAAHDALAAAFAALTDNAPGASETLTVMKRQLPVPRAAQNVAWFSFDELCDRPLAAADYLAHRRALRRGDPRRHPAARPAAAATRRSASTS